MGLMGAGVQAADMILLLIQLIPEERVVPLQFLYGVLVVLYMAPEVALAEALQAQLASRFQVPVETMVAAELEAPLALLL
jgi:hypothetical protein